MKFQNILLYLHNIGFMSRKMHLLAIIFLVSAALSDGATSLRLVKFVIPSYKLRGETALLECQYELNSGGRNHANTNSYDNGAKEYKTHHFPYDNSDQGETLYSVKWYKDNEEFYRYVPKSNPPQNSYKVDGIIVDHQQSDSTRVTLRGLTLKSSGLYRCEVSGEAPNFSSAQAESRMEILYLPKSGPHISGEERRYQIGDTLNLNCTSGKSHPASMLLWYINDDQVVSPDYLIHYTNVIHPHGLITSVLGLRMLIDSEHIRSSTMRVKCVASTLPLQWDGQESQLHMRPPSHVYREAMLLVRSKASASLKCWTLQLLSFMLIGLYSTL